MGIMTKDTDGQVTMHTDIPDIQYCWKVGMQENDFDIRCQESITRRVFGCGRHILVTNLHFSFALANLWTALVGTNPS